ncbi:right-handed parallel beta-helix repeat-containing protein [Euzebya tangerina]|uniref:right-handed parallel beta-helix repeat-containing protein n=1 Tax=Euzebya tangerina TaxID=591198 RepID=UPI0013C31597|nr:right-handed parallel beta-helix repeat-containing protein [Euzebya tangerina]
MTTVSHRGPRSLVLGCAGVLLLTGLFLVMIAGSAEAQEEVEVRMLDNSYDPLSISVAPGGDVVFVNEGRVDHNVLAVDGSFDSTAEDGQNTAPGEAFTVTVPDEDGAVDYYCSLHATLDESGEWQGMVGTLLVGNVQPEETGETTGAGGRASTSPSEWTGDTVRVPEEFPTIQSGVDAALPGDLVLVGPGIYREAVSVTTPGLTIRGTDRNTVILDGELTRENGFVVTADGVAIENMTARGYTVNGFFWNGVVGYRGSYLTAIDNWVYGIYAFDSVDGLFEHSYGSGSYDAGFYIGQCNPCDAVITDVVAEYNGLGYSGTNASGNIWIVDSVWRHNVAGIVPNTLDSELLPPTRDVVVAGNYIHDSGEVGQAPSKVAEWSAYGNGVVLAGVRNTLVRNNLIVNSPTSGVQVVSNIDASFWPSGGNEVRDNVIRGSGRADITFGGPGEAGSCAADNDADTTIPWSAGLLHNCDGINLPLPWGLATSSDALGRIAQAVHEQNPQLEHGEAPDPDLDFEQLPGGEEAEVTPAVNVFDSLDFDPDEITTPVLDEGLELDERRPVVFGVAVDGGFWPVWMGALLWWVPLAVWVLGGAWIIWRVWRSDRGVVGKIGWSVGAVTLPMLGVVGYAVAGNRAAPLGRRLAVGLGGLVLWLVVVVVTLLVGGVL